MLSVIRRGNVWLCLIGVLIFAVFGCSSSDVISPDITSATATSEGSTPRISISTNYDAAQPETEIVFDMAQAGSILLEVTNATGYLVIVLMDHQIAAGTHTVTWDGTNESGEEINPGIYLFHMVTSDYEAWSPFAWGIMPNGDPGEF